MKDASGHIRLIFPFFKMWVAACMLSAFSLLDLSLVPKTMFF